MSRNIKRKYTRRTIFNSIDQVNEELQKPSISLRVLAGIIIIAAILIGSVWQKVTVSQLAADIELLNKEKQNLEEEISVLSSKVLELSDGERVVKIAEEELGMITPETELLQLREIFHKSDLDD